MKELFDVTEVFFLKNVSALLGVKNNYFVSHSFIFHVVQLCKSQWNLEGENLSTYLNFDPQSMISLYNEA